jgi:hypothetical protein
VKNKTRTNNQDAVARERSTALIRQCNDWIDIRNVYIPGAVTAEMDYLVANPTPPQRKLDVRLWLPSELPPHLRETCRKNVHGIEFRYRIAQGREQIDALTHLRRSRVKKLSSYKQQLAGAGGRIQTRTQADINRCQASINRTVVNYRATYAALLALEPEKKWEVEHGLYYLNDNDVRGPTPQADKIDLLLQERRRLNMLKAVASAARSGGAAALALLSDVDPDSLNAELDQDHPRQLLGGRYTPSWIWNNRVLVDTQDPQYMEQVRAEWAQSMARASHWAEEVILLVKEMERIFYSLRTRYRRWLERVTGRISVEPDIRDGLVAYAHQQALDAVTLARHFASLWKPVVFAMKSGKPPWWDEATSWLPSPAVPKDSTSAATASPSADQPILASPEVSSSSIANTSSSRDHLPLPHVASSSLCHSLSPLATIPSPRIPSSSHLTPIPPTLEPSPPNPVPHVHDNFNSIACDIAQGLRRPPAPARPSKRKHAQFVASDTASVPVAVSSSFTVPADSASRPLVPLRSPSRSPRPSLPDRSSTPIYHLASLHLADTAQDGWAGCGPSHSPESDDDGGHDDDEGAADGNVASLVNAESDWEDDWEDDELDGSYDSEYDEE